MSKWQIKLKGSAANNLHILLHLPSGEGRETGYNNQVILHVPKQLKNAVAQCNADEKME